MLLLLMGPEAELVPLQHVNRISTPSPQFKINNNKQKAITLHSKRNSRKKTHHTHVKNTNLNNEPSLTTITEEPSWKSSASSISITNHDNGNISDSSLSQCHTPVPRVHNTNNLSRDNVSREKNNRETNNSNNYRNNVNYDANNSQQRTDVNDILINNQQPAIRSITVQPEVTVETHHNGNEQKTKVTTTTNIKIELTTSADGTAAVTSSSSSQPSTKATYRSTSPSNSYSSSNSSNSCSTNNSNTNHKQTKNTNNISGSS